MVTHVRKKGNREDSDWCHTRFQGDGRGVGLERGRIVSRHTNGQFWHVKYI